jgi:hypothetical protein
MSLADMAGEQKKQIRTSHYIKHGDKAYNEYGEVISSDDMAECMSKYFLQKPLYNKHADLMKQIPKIYKWETEVENMANVLLKL